MIDTASGVPKMIVIKVINGFGKMVETRPGSEKAGEDFKRIIV